jgi:maltooligosyltrehalose synthase
VRWISELPATRVRNRTEFDWGDTRLALPSGSPSLWESILTSEQLSSFAEGSEGYVQASDLFRDLPVALISGSLGSAS